MSTNKTKELMNKMALEYAKKTVGCSERSKFVQAMLQLSENTRHERTASGCKKTALWQSNN